MDYPPVKTIYLLGLDDPSLVNWRDIVKAQRNWIGECSGTRIDFKLGKSNKI